jgi:hypothetical protein
MCKEAVNVLADTLSVFADGVMDVARGGWGDELRWYVEGFDG